MPILNDKIANIEDDLLGRKHFAEEIAKSLLQYAKKNSAGITISITGQWGSGKSTLMTYIKHALKELQKKKEPIKIIEYNPWMFYKEGGVKENFLIRLALSLKDFETGRTSVSKKLLEFTKGFKFVKYASSTAGEWQQGIESFLSYFAKNDSIYEIKEQIEKILLKSDTKIFILLDDIDRLATDEILQLFQAISLILNFSNIFYVIAFDKEIVNEAIKNEYHDKAEDYIEKIIQVDYPIPAIGADDFSKIFFSGLHEFSEVSDLEIDFHELRHWWEYKNLSSYFSNVRDIKRYLNSLSFRLPAIAAEVNTTDFIVLEAIRLFDNTSYHHFYKFYTDNYRRRELPNSILTEEQYKTIKQPTKDILKALLPDSALQFMRDDINEKRIWNPACFERYFSLLLTKNNIKEKDFRELMERPKARLNILSTSLQNGTIDDIFNRLSGEKLAVIFPDYDFDLVLAIINFCTSHPGYFDEHHHRVSNAIINVLSRSKKKEKLYDDFFQLFKNQNGYPNLVIIYFSHFIRLFTKENRRFGQEYDFDEYIKKNYPIIMVNEKRDFENATQALLHAGFLEKAPLITYLALLNFAALSPDEYTKIFPTLLEDKTFILYMLKKFIWMSSITDKSPRYSPDPVLQLFPGEKFKTLYGNVQKLEQGFLNDEDRIYVSHFLKIKINENGTIEYPQ